MRPVAAPFDVVVTTNAGFPLDQNLYQAVKGMSAGQGGAPGGTIICAAECRDGFPDHGSYREVLASRAVAARRCSTRSRRREQTVPDQWQVQMQARMQAPRGSWCGVVPLRRRPGLGPPGADRGHRGHRAEALAPGRPGARVCVLPEGPQTIPYVGTLDGARA